VTVREARAEALPFDGASFDLVLCALMLEHVPDLGPPLAEMVRVLRPGGALVISVYHAWFLLRGVPPHFRDADGLEYEIPSWVHLPSSYFRALQRLGMQVTHMLEPIVDEEHVARLPKMQKHAGEPHALLLRAVKPV
jgi:ubiquinone/menaquinone biosynthesis C-methylase UbiE